MGILRKDLYTEKKWFDTRFKLLAQLWAWFMRRRGYETGCLISHLDTDRYLVRAGKKG